MPDTDIPAALIFDVDGTLAETEEAHRHAFNAAFAEAGLDWHWDQDRYRRLLDVTGGKERIRFHQELAGLSVLDDAAVARLHARKTALYVAHVDGGRLGLRPGIARLITQARAADIPLAIATTTSLANVESLLRATLGDGAPGWFAAIGAGDMVARKKPAPDIYRHVLDRLGVDPKRSVAFEDSVNGLDAARAAGLPTLVTVSRYTDDQQFTGALAVLDHLGEPDQPCRALAGRAPAGGVVNLPALRDWLRAS